MSAGNDRDRRLQRRLERDTRRLDRAEQDRPTLLAQATSLGVLGLVLVLPMVAGAYLGLWLDEQMDGYSLRWTLSLIFLGLVVGAVNVWLQLRR